MPESALLIKTKAPNMPAANSEEVELMPEDISVAGKPLSDSEFERLLRILRRKTLTGSGGWGLWTNKLKKGQKGQSQQFHEHSI